MVHRCSPVIEFQSFSITIDITYMRNRCTHNSPHHIVTDENCRTAIGIYKESRPCSLHFFLLEPNHRMFILISVYWKPWLFSCLSVYWKPWVFLCLSVYWKPWVFSCIGMLRFKRLLIVLHAVL